VSTKEEGESKDSERGRGMTKQTTQQQQKKQNFKKKTFKKIIKKTKKNKTKQNALLGVCANGLSLNSCTEEPGSRPKSMVSKI